MRVHSLDDITAWLRDKNDIAVITHKNPDGDAYGSALALVIALRMLGKRAFPVCDDEVEPKFRFLPGWEEFTNEQKGLPFTPAYAFGVDVADAGRMGRSEELFNKCADTAVIDHHGTNEGFAACTYVEPEAAAAGQIILDLIHKLGLTLTLPLAECLYTAISTDSGNFSFKDTSAASFRAAAECMEAGIDIEMLTRRLYRSRTLAATRLLGAALDSFRVSKCGKAAGVMLTDEMFDASGALRPEAHSIVNYMNEIQGVYVGMLAEQRGSDIKISFRGANDTDVSVLAKRFNGGGHFAAAGGTVYNAKLEGEFENILRACAEYVGDTL
ncbi:MAG: DHH family phosphoesterase [Clostridia bacterium]|nr:DHH family phosphoesterase [Clostridia bacterium]